MCAYLLYNVEVQEANHSVKGNAGRLNGAKLALNQLNSIQFRMYIIFSPVCSASSVSSLFLHTERERERHARAHCKCAPFAMRRSLAAIALNDLVSKREKISFENTFDFHLNAN